MEKQSLTLKGKSEITGGNYAFIKADGLARATGDIKAKSINIDGSFSCAGNVNADLVVCDGLAKFEQGLNTEKFDIDGSASVHGNLHASEIICDGLLTSDGEISADQIRAKGAISAREITGNQITIESFANRMSKILFKRSSKAELIEATMINLSGVEAKEVNGMIVKIGPKCHIQHLDCTDTLYIHPSAQVDRITGEYTRHEWA